MFVSYCFLLFVSYFTAGIHSHGIEESSKMFGYVGSAQRLGTAVDVSTDGKFAVLGAPTYQTKGGVLLYDVLQKKSIVYLVGSNSTISANQGSSAAISDTGYTVAFGGPTEGVSGSAWVWSQTGDSPAITGTWIQETKLVPADAVGDARFGHSVDMSRTGNTVVVGGPSDNSGIGAFWVFVRTVGSEWVPQGGKVVGTGAVGASGSRQGSSVSISGNGLTIAVGGWMDDNYRGATWVFLIDPDTNIWNQQGLKLVYPGLSEQAMQGSSVSLSNDGKVLAVGAQNDALTIGAVCMFTRSEGGEWTPAQKLVGTGSTANPNVFQGWSVGLAGDASKLVIGANADNATVGASWFFARNAEGVYEQHSRKLVGSGYVGLPSQGYAVSMSGNGKVFLVGGPDHATRDGAVWVYTLPTSTASIDCGMNVLWGLVGLFMVVINI